VKGQGGSFYSFPLEGTDLHRPPELPPDSRVPDGYDRLAALGADVHDWYDIGLQQFLFDRGHDVYAVAWDYPDWLSVGDREWWAMTVMRNIALAYQDHPGWRERWRP